MAKNRVHGANYRIGPAKAAKLTGVTEEEARIDLNRYRAAYPSLELWWREVEDQLRRSRTLTTPFGRKRTFFDRWSEDLIREAIAYVPQATIGDLLNLGIIRAWNNLPPEWEILLQNHDSVLVSVPENTDSMHIWKFFKHYFEIPLTIKGKTSIVPIDIKIGKNWGEMRELKLADIR
jgi:DNA polymerase I-like protein with 3'-5' exonuclease and polymerase domains